MQTLPDGPQNGPQGGPQHRAKRQWPPHDARGMIVQLCVSGPSVAEIAARLDLPVGVARVLIGDLVNAGYLRVHRTLTDRSSRNERSELIGRTLRGLKAL